jgi:ATP-dependent Clp protease ATP-binding subunit ClpB
MNPNQFTIKAQEVIAKAQQLVQEYGHQQIENWFGFISSIY